MRIRLLSVSLVLLFSGVVFGQGETRDQKLRKIDDLNSQVRNLETDVLLPDAKDFEKAGKEGFEVFRLMPRERYDRKLNVQGGGAYYSFTNRSHDYSKIPQISLEEGYLSVGFAGADYGFFSDLGNIPLAEVSTQTSGIEFLVKYRPPVNEPEIRAEQKKSHNYETENTTFMRRVPVSLDFTFALRAISFGEADVLVAFKVHRRDADGSLIIFWKMLENFEKPAFIRAAQSPSTSGADFLSASFSGNLATKIEERLKKRGFTKVKVSEENSLIVLRGTIPKGKLDEVLVIVADASGRKPINNQLTEN